MLIKSSVVKKLSAEFCMFYRVFNSFSSYILSQCKNMGIKIVKPADIKSFLDSLKDISKHKKKAANLLFEEIENDMFEKEKFVLDQTEKLKEMRDSY